MWLYGAESAVSENNLVIQMVDILDKALQLKDEPQAILVLDQCSTNFLKQGHTLLESFARAMQSPRTVRQALSWVDSFDSSTVERLEDFILSTLSGEDALEEGTGRCLWNAILKVAIYCIKKPDLSREIGHYALANL